MKTSFLKPFLVLIAALLLSLGSSPAQAARPLTVRIDGKLDDAAWKKAQPLVPFKKLDGSTPQAATTGLILTDLHYLYLAFRCQEPLMDKLEAVPLPRDGKIWTNDCIEIFIAPFQRQDEYFQVVVDTEGQIYDAFKREGKQDDNYDFSVTAQTHKQQNEWTIEIAIPLAEIGLSRSRDALMNFARERKAAPEDSTWHGLFSKPETWQTLPLALDKQYGIDVRDWKHSIDTPQYGRNKFTLDYVPATDTNAAFDLVLSVWENGKWEVKNRQSARGTAGRQAHLSLPYQLHPRSKPRALRCTLETKGQPIFHINYRLNLPPDALTATATVPYYYSEEKNGFVQIENFISNIDLPQSTLRLTIRDPQGKVQAAKTVTALRKSMLIGFNIEAWQKGTGQVTADLITDGKLMTRQNLVIAKRPGPFAKNIVP